MRVTRGIGVSQWWLELSLGRVPRAIIDGPKKTIVVLIVFEGKALRYIEDKYTLCCFYQNAKKLKHKLTRYLSL